jgi:hypothetical protein
LYPLLHLNQSIDAILALMNLKIYGFYTRV